MKRAVLVVVSVVMAATVTTPVTATTQRSEVRGAVVDCSAGTSCEITWDDPSDLTIFFGTAVDAIDATGAGVDAPGNSATVTGLDPNQRYYFRLVPAGAEDGTIVADRSLRLESSPNARDIGGYETKDGRLVRWGVVFRAGEIVELTNSDLTRMAGFGIKVVCDFRTDGEVELRGEDQLPAGVEYLQLPVADPNNDLGAKIETAIISEDRAAQEQLLGNGKSEKILLDAAPFLVSSKPARDAYRALLDRLTEPDALPTLTHCTAGKDRTGWSTAVILTALGVPKRTVIEDYLLTNELTAEQIESRIKSAAALMDDSELLRPLLEARTEYLEASFVEMKRKYGTFANYLRKGLGVSKADLEALKQNLLTD